MLSSEDLYGVYGMEKLYIFWAVVLILLPCPE